MSITIGSKAARSGLILNLDAADIKSAKGQRSLIHWDNWVPGVANGAGVANYGPNGGAGENSRVANTNPFGMINSLWQANNTDAGADDDGGWNGEVWIPHQTDKFFRYSTWMQRPIVGNGYSYLGTYNAQNGSGANTNFRVDGTSTSNPYFIAARWDTDLGLSGNTWYLWVGHVWPAGSGTGAANTDSGIYNTSGTKVFSTIYDFVPQYSTNQQFLRSYLYYSTDTNTVQRWYQPRLDLCDGTEPTISELLADVGNKWYDTSGSNNHALFYSGPPSRTSNTYYTVENSYFTFDGVKERAHVVSPADQFAWRPTGTTGLTSLTTEMWVRTTDTTGYLLSKSWNGSGEYNYYIQKDQFFVNIGAQSNSLSFTSIATGNWTHLVCTLDMTTMSVYINGALVAGPTSHGVTNVTPTNPDLNLDLCIMSLYPYDSSWAGDTSHAVNGDLATLKIYNRVLSADEVRLNYNATRSRFGL